MLKKQSILAAISLTVLCSFAQAEDRGQGRLFLGSTQIDPKDVNDGLEAQSMKKLDMINQYGVEITLPAFKVIQAGFRYTQRMVTEEEVTPNAATEYKTDVTQQVFAGVVRAPIVNRDYFKFDVVAGAGATSTELKLKTGTVDGSLDKKGFSSPMAFAGASVAVGYKSFFFTIEAGYEHNKVSSLKATNINNAAEDMDLSGSYLTVGLLFDNVPVFTK
ncbi:hypothetical protein [Pseudobdellovibrio sp. HCB154]|uniref:hypothetical protein n=1 Tax=Pseudobdellovibrio sp. HCB154 TaxID=3386277 RepID=UPI0039171D97